MNEPHFTVKAFTNPSGGIVWRLDGVTREGKRIRKNYESHGEAKAKQQDREAEFLNWVSAPMKATRLTPEQLAEAETCFNRLGNQSLTQAVTFFLENHRAPVTPCPVSEAFAQFIGEMIAAGRRSRTVGNLRSRVGYLKTTYGAKLVSDLQVGDLERAIRRGARSPQSQINDRAAFSAFCEWSVTKGYRLDNPVQKISTTDKDSEEIHFLSVQEAKGLVSAAAGFKDGIILPYVVLGLFCAIRPAELARLSWSSIDVDNRVVVIGERAAKTRSRRTVEIPENAAEWLQRYSLKADPIVGTNWRRYFAKVKKLAGFKKWPADVMRHTGMTFRLHQTGDEARTAQWAGNSPDVIHGSYKGILKGDIKTTVADFWSIRPDQGEENIIKMA